MPWTLIQGKSNGSIPQKCPWGTHRPIMRQRFLAQSSKRLYVGGLDHKIHAIDADPNLSSLPIDPTTGQGSIIK